MKINEFLANPDGGDDWIELHNSGDLPVALQGCAIITSNALARIASATFIGAGGCRFMCSWDTQAEDVELLIADLKQQL